MRKKHIFLLLTIIGYLGVHNGYLALYDDTRGQPLMVLPYQVDIYPAEDRRALTQGIPFDSQEALTRILEDFLS